MKELRKVIAKTLIAVWALAGGSLSVMQTGYVSDVPGAKYIFTVLQNLDGSGLEILFLLAGAGTCFYLVREEQKNPWVSGISAFFSICTVIGISYAGTGSWDCIFLYGTQFLMAVFVAIGYYFLYKNFILLIFHIFREKAGWLSSESSGRVSVFLFEKHPIWGPFFLLLVMGLPWILAFFPGTLQWDAHGQLWMAMGVLEQTGYHPVYISNYMAGCVELGRSLFRSDSVGLFFYTFPQFVVQSLVFSYVFYVMKKRKSPVLLRWLALLFWGAFPYFQIWGFTMVKDTPYYIGFVLFGTVLVDVLADRDAGVGRGQYILFAAATGLIVLSRNDGRYVVLLSLLVLVLCYRKYWKLFILGGAVCLCLLVTEEQIYMPLKGIPKGPAGEMLSVPLQQTARYLRDHGEELTEEEITVLRQLFDVEPTELAGKYNPEISDPVKSHFAENPDIGQLKAYAGLWVSQLKKHPDTYVQAFLNHIYGYFYPGCPNYGDYLTVTYLGNSDHWQDGYLDFAFLIPSDLPRDFLRNLIHTTEKMPGVSLLYGCGIYTYLLLGCMVWLLANKKRRELAVLVPEVCVLLICMVSPVNGYLRYMMPVMAASPVMLVWCFAKFEWKKGQAG